MLQAKILVAVSGGNDSVSLLNLMSEYIDIKRLTVGHVNHNTRSKASKSDATFVRGMARSLGCRFLSKTLPPPTRRLSEEGLRKARYLALETLAVQAGASQVALAHTADDQAETLLLRLTRGTGLAGLAGMPESRPLGRVRLVRPLLEIPRKDLGEYLKRHRIPFRTDGSNRDLGYARNRIRLKVLPQLARINPRVREALLRLSTQAQEASETLSRKGLAKSPKTISIKNGCILLKSKELSKNTPSIRAELWRRAYARLGNGRTLNASHLEALETLNRSGKGRVALPGKISARRSGPDVIIQA